MHAKSVRSVPTLCDPIDCSLPGSYIHGISQARILNGLLFPPPGDLSDPGIEPESLCLLHWQVDSFSATWEAHNKHYFKSYLVYMIKMNFR